MSDPRRNPELPNALARALDAVRRRHLSVRLAEFPVRVIIVLALAWTVQAAVDRWFELSWNTRLVLLILDAFAAAGLLWFFVIVPLRGRLDRRKAALLVERTVPKFRTSLISAVEFAEGGSGFPAASRPLVESLLATTAKEIETEALAGKVVSSRKLKRQIKWMAAAVVVAAIAFFVAMPLSPLLVGRVLLSQTPFPDETTVVGVTGDLTVIAGTDAVLSAKAGGVIPPSGRLVVTYGNGSGEIIPVPPSRTEHGLFQYTVKNVREGFGYRFQLNDGVGPQYKVSVRIPPSLKEIKFTQIYPKHTNLPETPMSPAGLRLLEGSKLRIEGVASEALRSAILEIKGADATRPLKIAGDGLILKEELTVPEGGWKSMSVHLTSAAGEMSANDPVYRVEIVRDRVPTVVLSQPKKDTITVVAGAKVPFVFKISDDFGLKRAALSYRVFRPGTDGDPIAAEGGELPIRFDPAERSISRNFVWDLSLLVPEVPVGSAITCWIEAEDNHPDRGRVPTKSADKVIRIVSEQQKREELLELMGERAKDIERLYELQRGMNERTDNSIR